MLSKTEIRREVRTKRNLLDAASREAATDKINAQLLSLDAVRDARTWFVYVSYGSEVGTHQLIRMLLTQAHIVCVPRITGSDAMIPLQILAFDELYLGEFGILAPPPGKPFSGAIDVCVCPGVAFTEHGERLGAGRRFYDRFLAAHPPRLAIGLAYECQLVPQLPLELHDRRMDFVVTEKRVIESTP
ncbi:MAG TPA: 5-formyltetrahydrofolate cyclo-ligase [Pirellulales bacterium]